MHVPLGMVGWAIPDRATALHGSAADRTGTRIWTLELFVRSDGGPLAAHCRTCSLTATTAAGSLTRLSMQATAASTAEAGDHAQSRRCMNARPGRVPARSS